MLFSDAQVQQHMSQYLREAYGLRPEVDHMLQVCLLFVQCKEVCFKAKKVERTCIVLSTHNQSRLPFYSVAY